MNLFDKYGLRAAPIGVEVPRASYLRLSAQARTHFELQACEIGLDLDGKTYLGFEMHRAKDAAALMVAVALKNPARSTRGPEPTTP